MQTPIHSVHWGIALTLFAGGIGIPVPENALLIAGGYALYQKICPPVPAVVMWYTAILSGDVVLFLLMRWVFTRPSLSAFMNRFVKPDKLEKYKRAFSRHAAWTLFLARFTFGIRAVAYVAAGAANYPLRKFLAIDGLSVGLQIVLFIGVGYYGSGQIEWAKAAVHEIAILLTIFAVLSILASVAASMLIKQFADRKS